MIKISPQLRLTSDNLRGFSEPGWRPPEMKTHTALPAVMFTACVIDQKWWMLNTTFLLLLAATRRRSYLHALCVSTCLFTCGDVQNQSVLNLLPHTVFIPPPNEVGGGYTGFTLFWLRTRCLIRLSSGYVFPASIISTQMSWRECCVGKVMWIHHQVRRCGCTCDQWTVFHST